LGGLVFTASVNQSKNSKALCAGVFFSSVGSVGSAMVLANQET
jgi:hypothetical protein